MSDEDSARVIEKHLLKLRARSDVSPQEEQAIRGLISHVVEVAADCTVIRAGRDLRESTLLLEGWMARAKDLPSGQRLLAELHVPGDFTDLHGFTLKRLDHDIIAITRCSYAVVPHERLVSLTEQFPHLARLYWLMTNIDAANHREWTLSLGRRSAQGRMAHLFCEMLIRLEVIGMADNRSYDFPLTQTELGECLGLTAVHVNRTLQELRRAGLITLEGRRLTILDLESLQSIAQFDADYLYLEKRLR